MTTVQPGTPYPLGATWDGQGVNFALFSRHATRIELCLFDTPDAPHERERIPLPERTNDVWHVYLPGVQPGQLYGYRVYGPYEPRAGHRFNPSKLLIDPYARALSGTIRWNEAVYSHPIGRSDDDHALNTSDSAPYVPRCVVIDPAFDWGEDTPPATPLHESLIYELHVKGFTRLNEAVPEHLRGTYAGLATPPVIAYLQSLGVTAVELLPVHQHVDDYFLVRKGLRNYWGYSTIGFFAPDVRYSSAGTHGEQVREFKHMVKALHAAGIEIILDVVYNHTAEGNRHGPTLSWRGIDNRVYYWLDPDDPRRYVDFTGTGNSLNVRHMQPLHMVMDSLRYWVQEMHVDGFRFDLASTLARGQNGVDPHAPFLAMVHQDPVLSRVKLIAEPWDISPDGYMVGKFPPGWSEWNGKYRDAVRRFWNGHDNHSTEFAYRLIGSPDLYEEDGRRPQASINYVTCHDGFTLRDLVSYNKKHNEANQESNHDGDDYNNSWNFGVEGPTEDPAINAMRAQQQRTFLATLLLSQGTPMLLAGDERNRTQRGNNNAYCQDSEISWLNWQLDDTGSMLLAFTRRLIQIRKAHAVLRRRRFFHVTGPSGSETRDLVWYRPDGTEIRGPEWGAEYKCFGILFDGQRMEEWDAAGTPLTDARLLILLNGNVEAISFTLPAVAGDTPWEVLVDTASPHDVEVPSVSPGATYPLQGRALVLLHTR